MHSPQSIGKSAIFCLALLSLGALSAPRRLTPSIDAQEWTRFRGPNGSGQSEAKTIPEKWTDTDLNWKRELPGAGNGSPVLWGDLLFLMSGDPETSERFLLCLAADSGQIVWRKNFPSKTHKLHQKSSYGSSTPAVDAEFVYFAWSDPDHTWLRAFRHDGTPVWTIDLGPWLSMHGFGTSPMLYEDLVIVSASQESPSNNADDAKPQESYVAAVERTTGKLRWKTPREVGTASYSVPCLYQPAEGPVQLLCTDTTSGMFSLDPRTGKPLWNVTAFSKRTVSSPVIIGDLAFGSTGAGGGGNYVSAIRLGEKPSVAYDIKSPAPYVPCVVPYGELVFLWGDNGIVRCIQASDGTIHWTERVGGNFFGSPVRVADKVYCMSEEGDAVVIAASKDFRLLGRTPLGEGSRATPAVAKGRMYLRTYSHLICIGAKSTLAQLP
jgi:outer membrane protein assembly factor BamB